MAFIDTMVGTAMGAATAKFNDERQIKQAEKLQKMSIEGGKEMGKFNQGLAIDTFNKTASPEAKRKQYMDAGLNTGLMYGGAGTGGGATTTGGTPVNVGSAPVGGGEIGMGMQLGLQQAMQKAQIDNVNKDTEVKEATKNKLEGVDTENVQANTAVLRFEADIKEIERDIKDMSQMDAIKEIKAEADKTLWESRKAKTEAGISEATQASTIEQMNKATVEQQLRIAGARLGLELDQQQMKKVAEEIYQLQISTEYRERDMTNRELQTKLNAIQTEFNTSDAAKLKQWTSIVTDILKAGKPSKNVQVNKWSE